MLKRFGDALLAVGALVAVGAVVAYSLNLVPTLPPEVMKLVLYKLLFIGAVGMIVAGGFVRKLAARPNVPLVGGSRAGNPSAISAGMPESPLREPTSERIRENGPPTS